MNELPLATKQAIDTLLKQYQSYLDTKESALRIKISNEMFFASPLIWLGYKYDAYQGTKKAITTMGDLRNHCSEKTDICAKRFAFLSTELLKLNVDLNDRDLYPDTKVITDLLSNTEFITKVEDLSLIQNWNQYEYYTYDGTVAKWQNYQFGI